MILCDTGPLVAAFNEADSDHIRCAEFLTRNWVSPGGAFVDREDIQGWLGLEAAHDP